VEDGATATQPLRTLGQPIADLMGPMPYVAMQSLLDLLWGPGAHNYLTSALLDRLDDAAIDTLLARHAAGTAPVRELHLYQCGGAMGRIPADATAYAHRDAAYVLEIIARSPERDGFQDRADWARTTQQAMGPWATGGGYVNFTLRTRPGQGAGLLPPDTYARLVAVKDRYDPANLFRLNQNIRPSGHR
jgi:FAD/FMN-containing dehydrogenase